MASPSDLLKQKDLFRKYFSPQVFPLSSHSFVSLFIWQDFFKFELKTIEDCLCIFARDRAGVFMYMPPLGKKISRDVIKKCFEDMQKENRASKLTRIENVGKTVLSKFPTKYFSRSLKTNEYIYRRQDIAEFKGNLYKSQRSSYNQAVKNYQPRFLAYQPSMIEGCLDLYKHWADSRRRKYKDDMYGFMIEDNLKVHLLALKYFKELDLVGRVVVIKEKIAGYTFGYELAKECFCVLFEIVDLDVKGLSAYIFREFCRDNALKPYKFVNAMDDLGQLNLKQTKMAFHPYKLIPSYTISARAYGLF